MTSEEYAQLVTNIYTLISNEIDEIKEGDDLAIIYPKLVTMYEFFRLLRGEAFVEVRPHTPDQQNDFYKMEDEISKKIDQLKTKMDFNNEKVNFYIKEAQKSYLN